MNIRGNGESVVPGSPRLHWRVGGGAWQSTPLGPPLGDQYPVTLPPTTCHATIDWYLSATGTLSGEHVYPSGAPGGFHTTPAGIVGPVISENFGTNPGWTATGEWQFGAPIGAGGATYGNPDPASAATGTNVYGINLNGDYAPGVGAPSHLTWGPLDLSTVTGAEVRYRRWLNTDTPPWVYTNVEIGTIDLDLAQPPTVTGGAEHVLFLRYGIPGAAERWVAGQVGTFVFTPCWDTCPTDTFLLAASTGWPWHTNALSTNHALTPWAESVTGLNVPFDVTIQGAFMDAGNIPRITNALVIRHQ